MGRRNSCEFRYGALGCGGPVRGERRSRVRKNAEALCGASEFWRIPLPGIGVRRPRAGRAS